MAKKEVVKEAQLRIGVLMGGRSIEREVSFNSGRTICDHLDASIYDIIPLYQTREGALFILPWHFLHRGKTSDFEHRLEKEAQKIVWDDLKICVDFIYSALHGKYAEDGTLQGILSLLDIPFLGSDILCGAICMNKALHKTILRHAGIRVPQGTVLSKNRVKQFITKEFSTQSLISFLTCQQLQPPFIVKPNLEGSSLGVSAVFSFDELEKAIRLAALCDGNTIQEVLIEEKIEGMEFVSINVEEKNGMWKSLPVTEIVYCEGAHFFDYRQKYMPGLASKITPARCSEKDQLSIQEVSKKVTEILGFKTVSRIDGFLSPSGEVIIVDSQPITGMAPATFLFDQAAALGMSHTDLINHFIQIDLSRYGFAQPLGNEKMKQHIFKNESEKMRIGVLLGGGSREREISFESGRNVCYKLYPNKYKVTPLFVTPEMELYPLTQRELVKNTTRDIFPFLKKEKKIKWNDLSLHFDFIFNALHGGKGENGVVQGTLEMLGIPYNGSGIFASALCMDKFKTTHFLKKHNFHVPHGRLLGKDEWKNDRENILKQLLSEFSFPCIIKPHDDGCSMLVSKIHSLEECMHVLDGFFSSDKSHAFIEEYIHGIELTCGVLGNENPKALPPSAPTVQNAVLSLEEKFLPGAGENQTPAPLEKNTMDLVMKTVEEVYATVQCSGYARIDCFYQESSLSPTHQERVVILEINTLPGLTPATCIFHQAAEIGLKPMEFIDTIISLGMERFNNRNATAVLSYEQKALQEAILVR